MKRVMVGIILLLSAFLAVKGYGQEIGGDGESRSISGEVVCHGQGLLLIFLVDEESFARRNDGLAIRIIPVPETDRPIYVPFEFPDLPDGEYGVRCFLDENGNGELDGGAFGPKEPWGMSWREGEKRGVPRFSDIAFDIRDGSGIEIRLADG